MAGPLGAWDAGRMFTTRITSRLTFANVMSALALFTALGVISLVLQATTGRAADREAEVAKYIKDLKSTSAKTRATAADEIGSSRFQKSLPHLEVVVRLEELQEGPLHLAG